MASKLTILTDTNLSSNSGRVSHVKLVFCYYVSPFLFLKKTHTKKQQQTVTIPVQLVTHQTRCSLALQFGDSLLNLVEHGARLFLRRHHLLCTLALLCQVNVNGVKLGEFFFVHFLPVLVPFWQDRWQRGWRRDARWLLRQILTDPHYNTHWTRNSFIYFLSLIKKKRSGSRRDWCTKKVQEQGFLLFRLFCFFRSYWV